MDIKSCLVLCALIACLCVQLTTAIVCHSCEGQPCLRTSQVNTVKTCPTTTDRCVTLFSGYMPIKKGCYSELSPVEKTSCDQSSDVSCYDCSVDRCNNLGRVDHTCKVCTGTSSSSTCINSVSTAGDTRCSAPRTQGAYCSLSILNGMTTRRDCVMSPREILECVNNSTTCTLCEVTASGACNTVENFPTTRRQCLYCSGSGDTCKLTNTTTTAAVSRLCPKIDDQCLAANVNNTYKRLCASEIAVLDQEYCGLHNTSCVYCSSNNCNTAIPPNIATAIIAGLKLILGGALAVLLLSSHSG